MRKIVLALALVLLPLSVQSSPVDPFLKSPPQRPARAERSEARLEQQKSKWAPNGMKVLVIHGKPHWVEQRSLPPVEKQPKIPIQKEGV